MYSTSQTQIGTQIIRDSAVVSADIRDLTIVGADLANNIAKTTSGVWNFTNANSSIGGVGAGNIPDLTSTETVSGAWNFTDTNSSIGGVAGVNLPDLTANETVSGTWNSGAKTIMLPPAIAQEDDGSTWTNTVTAWTTGATGTQYLYFPVPLKSGDIVNDLVLYGYHASTNDITDAILYRIANDNSSSVLATFSTITVATSTTNWTSTISLPTAYTMAAGHCAALEVRANANATATNVRIYNFEVNYTHIV